MATVVRKQQEAERVIWWKTTPCGKKIAHPYHECQFHHRFQGVDDLHLLWPEHTHSIPWSPERFVQQQTYYENEKAQRIWQRQAALELERKMRFLEFEGRGELKAVRCKVMVDHDWKTCRFGHDRVNPRTGMWECDFDPNAIQRRNDRLTNEKAKRRQERIEARVKPDDVNFPALGQQV
jgi:hypothetical protein